MFQSIFKSYFNQTKYFLNVLIIPNILAAQSTFGHVFYFYKIYLNFYNNLFLLSIILNVY